MTSDARAKPINGPRKWCCPHTSFGKLEVEARVWQPPSGSDPVVVAQFRAAVMQNAIAVHVREFKNGHAIRRTGLVALDNRLDSQNLWDGRLNGTENLTTQDIATLLTILPEAMPPFGFIEDFLKVAEGRVRFENWRFPDTSTRSPS